MIEQTACFLGVEKGTLLVPFSILLSSLIGAGAAYWAIKTNRKIARLKNSMDFLNGFNEADAISKAWIEVQQLDNFTTAEKQKLAAKNLDDEQKKKTENIRIVLNYYEAMALCVHHKVYDEIIIKEAIYTTVMVMWDICQPYIEERNKVKKTGTFYQELAMLVKKWEKSPLKKK